MKIIFLDVDGVLNSDFRSQRQIASGQLIDEEKVQLLSKIVRRTGAELVLHSGWRFWLDDHLRPIRSEAEQLTELLKKYGMKLLDKTDDLSEKKSYLIPRLSLTKGDEILLWLQSHPEVKKYVILEDLDLHKLRLKSHHVQTDPCVGLIEEDVERAVTILGEK